MEHLTEVSMPRAGMPQPQTRTFTYDPTSHLLVSERHPETGLTRYSYTADGITTDLLTSKTDAKGQVSTYTYDHYYRVTLIQRYPTGLSGNEDICQRVAYTYDSYSNSNSSFTAANAWGRVAAVTTGAPSCTVPNYMVPQQFIQMFSYSQTGHVTTKRLQLDQAGTGSQWWDVGYTYNQLGQVVSTTYPGATNANGPLASTGRTYTVSYDPMGRPAGLQDDRSVPVVQNVTYNAASQPLQTQFQQGNGLVPFWENRSYNRKHHMNTTGETE